MEIRPIFSALTRNKTGASLIALQIAFTLAVIANAVFIVEQRVEKMGRETGMDVDNLIVFSSSGFVPDFDIEGAVRQDLETLRAMPGVVAATVVNQVPLSGGGDSTGYRASPETPHHEAISANNYTVDEQGVETLGIALVSGRDFTAEEIAWVDMNSAYFPNSVLVTRTLGEALWGDEDALGKTIYSGNDKSATVVGVIEHMQGAWVNWDGLERIVIGPMMQRRNYQRYMVRAEPGQRDLLIPVIEKTLAELNRGRIIRKVTPHADIVARSYARDRAMAVMLVTVTVLLIAITTLGIVGLASFSVSQRTKQIGTRRAIGARRLQIVRYFLVENAMVTTAGIVLGGILALFFNYWLVTEYELPPLDFVYLVGGMMALLVLGQLAVLLPARRASRIPPAIATRTV